MATYNYVKVQMEEARYLADLHGIQSDLQDAIEFCNYLLDIYRIEKPDFKLVEPLSIAILIKYSRPFVSGVRKRLLINNVVGLTDDELEHHKNIIAHRNKHIAHSVNEFEENEVKAYYNEEKVDTDGITSIGLGHARLISISGYEAESIIELSNKIINYVISEMKAEKSKLLDLVRTQPIDEVLRGGISVFDPQIKNVDSRRKQ